MLCHALDAAASDHGGVTRSFEPLGKPHRPIFDAACARLATRNVVMVGDQLATDIRGANDAGLVSALVRTGVGAFDGHVAAGAVPRYVLDSLAVTGQ
jgi:ribonucleotide monophosphatase NagD (HAD superfamily)